MKQNSRSKTLKNSHASQCLLEILAQSQLEFRPLDRISPDA